MSLVTLSTEITWSPSRSTYSCEGPTWSSEGSTWSSESLHRNSSGSSWSRESSFCSHLLQLVHSGPVTVTLEHQKSRTGDMKAHPGGVKGTPWITRASLSGTVQPLNGAFPLILEAYHGASGLILDMHVQSSTMTDMERKKDLAERSGCF
jgi:hypothetical protein